MIAERRVYLDFMTDLSIEECVKRLKDGPSQVIEHRLSVRTDGKRFIVEVLEKRGLSELQRVAVTLDGILKKDTSGTRVKGYIKYTNPMLYFYILGGFIAMILLLFLIVGIASGSELSEEQDSAFTLALTLLILVGGGGALYYMCLSELYHLENLSDELKHHVCSWLSVNPK